MPDTINYIPRMINFSSKEFEIVNDVVLKKGLGGKGFSAAVRLIINEWHELVKHTMPPPEPKPERSANDLVGDLPDSSYTSTPPIA